jgi:hypothetical protein
VGPVLDDDDEPEKPTSDIETGLQGAAYRHLPKEPLPPPQREIICTLSREEIDAIFREGRKCAVAYPIWKKWKPDTPMPRQVQFFLRHEGHAHYADGGDAYGPPKGAAS